MSLILDRICNISHLTPDTDNTNKEQYQTDTGLTAVAINIQPASPEDTILSDGVFAQTWIGFATQSGIRSGDLLTISGAKIGYPERSLVVKGVTDWDMFEIPHYELLLTEFLEDGVN